MGLREEHISCRIRGCNAPCGQTACSCGAAFDIRLMVKRELDPASCAPTSGSALFAPHGRAVGRCSRETALRSQKRPPLPTDRIRSTRVATVSVRRMVRMPCMPSRPGWRCSSPARGRRLSMSAGNEHHPPPPSPLLMAAGRRPHWEMHPRNVSCRHGDPLCPRPRSRR